MAPVLLPISTKELRPLREDKVSIAQRRHNFAKTKSVSHSDDTASLRLVKLWKPEGWRIPLSRLDLGEAIVLSAATTRSNEFNEQHRSAHNFEIAAHAVLVALCVHYLKAKGICSNQEMRWRCSRAGFGGIHNKCRLADLTGEGLSSTRSAE